MRARLKTIARPMLARDPEDKDRVATQLELFFDLVFVIAIAAAAMELRHAINDQAYLSGTLKFLAAYFALWWPWVHFTWFASAFDNDDPAYRVAVMVMMFGVILIAGGIVELFENTDLRLMALGYIIIRLAYVYLWFRAGRANPQYRKIGRRSAIGHIILQALWMSIAFSQTPDTTTFYFLLLIAMIGEISVPAFAVNASYIPFNKRHIVERYGLLNIIVLGEILLSAGIAIQARMEGGSVNYAIVFIAVSVVVTTFCLWWLYFCVDEHLVSPDNPKYIFLWGYGHFFIFAPGAAIGSGFAALVDASKLQPLGSYQAALWATSISIALYLFGVWLIRDRHILRRKPSNLLWISALVIALTPLLPMAALPVLTIVTVAALVIRLSGRAERDASPTARR